MIGIRTARWMLFGLLAVALSAGAQQAQSARPVNVYAGPDRKFPVVTFLTANTDIYVHGCTEGRRWCDVQSGRIRGWVQGNDLTGAFRAAPPRTVTFALAAYWDEHYQRQRWYATRDQWVDWERPGFVPPPTGRR